MKSPLRLLVFIFASLSLVSLLSACKDARTGGSGGQAPDRETVSADREETDLVADARIVSATTPAEFHTAIEQVAGIKTDQLGSVSGAARSKTGVFVGGRICARNIEGDDLQVRKKSQILLEIWDTLAVSQKQLGKDLSIPILFSARKGSVQNGRVNIVFANDSAELTLRGSIDGNAFNGHVSVKVEKRFDGTLVDDRADLGDFEVETNSFFSCN